MLHPVDQRPAAREPADMPPRRPIPEADATAALLGALVARLGGSEVARRLGTTPARISLIVSGRPVSSTQTAPPRLTDAQREALDVLDAEPEPTPDEPAPTEAGQFLDAACARLGITMTVLAARLGVSKHHLSRARSGARGLGRKTRRAIEAMLEGAEPAGDATALRAARRGGRPARKR